MSSGSIDLSVTLGKMRLKNPVMPSAGTFGYGKEFADLLDLSGLGAIIVKCTSLNPMLGNYEDRSIEIGGSCFLTSVGRQNVGVDRFVRDKLPFLRQFPTPVIVNVAGTTIEEYVRVIEILNEADGVSGVELSMRCPNLKHGMADFTDPDTAFKLVKAVRESTQLTVIPKLNATLADIVPLAKACEEGGADAVCPRFDMVGMAIDISTRRSRLGKNLFGALGGPMAKPTAVRLVWQVAQELSIPVIGCGGITGPEDAVEFFIAGATAVEVGSFNLIDPAVMPRTIEGIRHYLAENGASTIEDIKGSFLM
ncbi:MAG: dihydroorotate dehydrogenase [Chloroflexota bacterium]